MQARDPRDPLPDRPRDSALADVFWQYQRARNQVFRFLIQLPKPDYLSIITAYLPDPAQWSPDFRTRK